MAQEKPLERLAEINKMVFDPNARFSRKAVLAELDRIETATGADTPDRGRVTYLRHVVERKAGRDANSVQHGEAALSIDERTPFLAPRDRMMLIYYIAQHAEGDDDCAAALPLYRRTIALMTDSRDIKEDERLAARERLGYCLHETRQFAEARHVNEGVLSGAEALFGLDSPKLMTVLTNLAQNNYELKDLDTTRSIMERVLPIAIKVDDAEVIDRTLFQLGVLAFETGRADDACDLMQRRLDLATASGDEERIETAEEALQTLKKKLSAGASR
jgi:tetratricopeptide (TPR) repeat protein